MISLVEYKKESFQLFEDMMARFQEETIRFLFYLRPAAAPPELRRTAGVPLGDSDVDGASSHIA